MTFDEYLEEKQIRGSSAAKELGVSDATISGLRHGGRAPSLDLARKIFAWSDGAVDFLRGGVEGEGGEDADRVGGADVNADEGGAA